MLNQSERAAIAHLWERKLNQDAQKLPVQERHRNLEPASAEFISALASGIQATTILDIGGSSGISTIALAAAARDTNGKVISIEIEPTRQAEARKTIQNLGLSQFVEFRSGDAAEFIPQTPGVDLALIDCEKNDYIKFFDLLLPSEKAVVVADNILSHNLMDYVSHVRRPGNESLTLQIGKGLEVTRIIK